MKRLLVGVVLGFLGMVPPGFADLTDYMLNINGTSYCPSGTGAVCSSNGGFAAAPGVVSTVDTSFGGTGLGTVTLTFNPGAPGTYNANLWVFEQLATPGFNEFGAVNGSAATGQSWQIDVPDYDYNNASDPNFGGLPAGAGSIIGNTKASTLANNNYVTGNTLQDLTCTGLASCNDFTSMAMGFNFTLGASQEEVLTFTVSNTNPGGFSLEQIHPVDPFGNNSETDYFFTGSATTQAATTGGGGGGGGGTGAVPEPGSLPLVATLAGLLAVCARRFGNRSAAGKVE